MQTLYDWLRAERLDFFEEELFELFTTDVILVHCGNVSVQVIPGWSLQLTIKFKEFGI
jgi:hypothetical protein